MTAPGDILIVIPTLNEEDHIGALLDGLAPFVSRHAGTAIVVADGGSADRTVEIASARVGRILGLSVIPNPGRTQAAAVNLAVRQFGARAAWLIRIDAHSAYPGDYCDVLLAEAALTGADSVVVPMRAVGQGGLHSAIADAQNSRLGNGGSPHRLGGSGSWVDHGHHALMRVPAFRSVGGYDEAFTHNEDAELDHRLRAAGYRIWLTARTRVAYFPRRSLPRLMQQYYRFGRGRAQNLAKHGMRLAPRQLAVSALAPALALGVLVPLHPVFAVPAALWLVGCVAGGALIAAAQRTPRGVVSGFAAGAMHVAWSAGFWRERLLRRKHGKAA